MCHAQRMGQKTRVIVDGQISDVDWIMHEGKAWLVPEWRISPDGKSMQPSRIISLALALDYKDYKKDLGEVPLVWFLTNPIPKSLLDRGVPPRGLEKVYEIREEPEIWLPKPEFSH